MNTINLKIKSIYDSDPCYLKIISNKSDVIFEGLVKEDLELSFNYLDLNKVLLEIQKSGKDIDIVKKNYKQIIIIESLTMNGCSLHPEKFGKFYQSNNVYLKDSVIQTDTLSLNGVWSLELPCWNINGIPTLDTKKFRDHVDDCDIACFGCSFTYGSLVSKEETWPYLLGKKIDKVVLNYGIRGSNNQEIFANAIEYSKKYNCRNIILLLCHFCRLQLFLPKTNMLVNWHPTQETKIKDEIITDQTKKMLLYSEDSIILSSQVKQIINFIETIEKNISGRVHISCYIKEQYDLLSEIKEIKDRLLPIFYLDPKFTLASDNLHPGPKHYEQWIDEIKTKFLYI
jgi:hypothetical protein